MLYLIAPVALMKTWADYSLLGPCHRMLAVVIAVLWIFSISTIFSFSQPHYLFFYVKYILLIKITCIILPNIFNTCVFTKLHWSATEGYLYGILGEMKTEQSI